RSVAVRWWRGEEPQSQRMLELIRAAIPIQHPMYARLVSSEASGGGQLCVVSEYVAGRTLNVWLAEHGLPSTDHARDLVYRLCRVLEAAQLRGVTHHAPWPGNLVVLEPNTRPGGRIWAKLLDLGIPSAMRPWPPRLEAAHFMAPEWLAATGHDETF